MDFTILKDTTVSQGEFAQLVPVSRATVNSWVLGKSVPQPKFEKKVRQLLVVLRMARDARMLPERLTPVKRSDKETRMIAIRKVIAAIVKQAKAK
jgi:hypothetical protein